MLIVVSTIKGTLDNLLFFLTENRTVGVDHFFIFWEGDKAVVDAVDFSYVTFVDSLVINSSSNLNERKVGNLSRINSYLCSLGVGDLWLASIDGDEVLDVCKSEILGLPNNIHQVQLVPVESVSIANIDRQGSRVFKRILSDVEIFAAYALGYVKEPSNECWLSGSVKGKYLVRPKPGLVLGEYETSYPEESIFRPVNMFLRRYVSLSFSEFKEECMAQISDEGALANDSRKAIYCAAALLQENVNFEERMRQIYGQWIEDKDIENKMADGLLFEIGGLIKSSDCVRLDVGDDFRELIAQGIQDVALQRRDVDALRDAAIVCERLNIDLSLSLMELAYKYRPQGQLIKNKLDHYRTSRPTEGDPE
jgi:hypothetical protein